MARLLETRQWVRILLVGCLLTAFGTGLPAQDDIGRKPGRPGPLTRQQALERFRKASPEDRLQYALKAAPGGNAFVPVTRGDLTAAIVERGSADAAEFRDVICRVKARSATTAVATKIKWLIDDGSYVKKGQKLIELDDSVLREQVQEQSILVTRATAQKAVATANLELVQTENALAIRTAQLNLEITRRDLKRYSGVDPEEKKILGTKVELAELGHTVAKLRARARDLEAQTALEARAIAEAREVTRKRALGGQLDECVLEAPLDGFAVVYVPEGSRLSSSPIVAPGEPVREGQKLMRVCKLDRFVLLTRIHEAQITRIRPGQIASVRVDAFPQGVFRARVLNISRIASQGEWLRADVKVYPVALELLDHPPGLKPGMTAEVRIDLEHRKQVVQVPVESIVQIGRVTLCYVKVGKELQERQVTPGGRNERVVEIQEGLKEAEVVLRAPARVLDTPAK